MQKFIHKCCGHDIYVCIIITTSSNIYSDFDILECSRVIFDRHSRNKTVEKVKSIESSKSDFPLNILEIFKRLKGSTCEG